jgi:hypothetical protein
MLDLCPTVAFVQKARLQVLLWMTEYQEDFAFDLANLLGLFVCLFFEHRPQTQW